MSSNYGDFQFGMPAQDGDPSVAQAVAEALRRKKLMEDNSPPPPDPYGGPAPRPDPQQAAAAAPAAQADPYGAPLPVSDADLKAALDAYTSSFSQPTPKAPFGYGRRGLITGMLTENYNEQMRSNAEKVAAAKAKYEGLRQMNVDAGLERERLARTRFYGEGGRKDAKTRWEDAVDAAYKIEDPDKRQAELDRLDKEAVSLGFPRNAPAPKSRNAWDVIHDPNATQEEKDLAKRSVLHDYPQNTPPPMFDPMEDTTDEGDSTPMVFDRRRGQYLTPDHKPYEPKGHARRPGADRAFAPGGGIDKDAWKQASKEAEAEAMLNGLEAPDPNDILARYQKIVAVKPGSASSAGKGGKPQFTHISGSGKYGWDGTKWVPIQQPQQ